MGYDIIRKYVWVINTIITSKRITFDELNQKWVKSELSGGNDLPKRTFDNWCEKIAEIFNLDIENERKGEYYYYIPYFDELKNGSIESWIYNTMSVGNMLINSQRVKDRIQLETVPSSQEFLQLIIEAMKENRAINMTYHSYWHDQERTFDVQPYCVKLFRQRWYMIAQTYIHETPHIYALDRILNLSITDKQFEMPKNWNAAEYYNDYFGVIIYEQSKKEVIKLQFTARQAKYIRDLPLHASQKELEDNVFEYRLCPGYEFIHEILRYGNQVKVLEPQSLRETVANEIRGMAEQYADK